MTDDVVPVVRRAFPPQPIASDRLLSSPFPILSRAESSSLTSTTLGTAVESLNPGGHVANLPNYGGRVKFELGDDGRSNFMAECGGTNNGDTAAMEAN